MRSIPKWTRAGKLNFILLPNIVVWNFPNGFCKLNLIKLCACMRALYVFSVCVYALCVNSTKWCWKESELAYTHKAHINKYRSVGLGCGTSMSIKCVVNRKNTHTHKNIIHFWLAIPFSSEHHTLIPTTHTLHVFIRAAVEKHEEKVRCLSYEYAFVSFRSVCIHSIRVYGFVVGFTFQSSKAG